MALQVVLQESILTQSWSDSVILVMKVCTYKICSGKDCSNTLKQDVKAAVNHDINNELIVKCYCRQILL